MMRWMRPAFGFCLAFALLGCQSASRNRPVVSTLSPGDKTTSVERANAAMVDNAMLHDMTVADLHFVPHTGELNGTGVARLTRMAHMLDVYGGTVRYETFESNEDLLNLRLAHVHEFLASTGCDMERVEVRVMLSGGRSLRAKEAIRIMEEGTVNDTAESGGDAGGIVDPTQLSGG